MNPLKPCGACNEWLKKIAEVMEVEVMFLSSFSPLDVLLFSQSLTHLLECMHTCTKYTLSRPIRHYFDQVNPQFKVLTFTDALCEGVYLEQIWE